MVLQRDAMTGSASSAGHVVLVSKDAARRDGHERAMRVAIARRIAALMGYEFAGEHDASLRHPTPLYFVPDDTLLHAHSLVLGIAHETDLCGSSAKEKVERHKEVLREQPGIGPHPH